VLTLLVLQGPDKGRRFELPDAPAFCGRDSRALPLTDNTVSRRHFELHPLDAGDWLLKDLGSSNGTYVNGGKVAKERTLKLGDQIRVGRTIMVFGAQRGVSRVGGGQVALAGEEAGVDASIMHTVPSSEDSMVLAVPEPAAAAMNNLRVLYQLAAALGTSFDVQQILEVVMDLVFEYVKADRGIVLLIDERDNQLVPRVVRTRDDEAAANGSAANGATTNGATAPGKAAAANDPLHVAPKIQASRTIINHVINTGEGVLSSNAMADQRFSKGKSVHSMGIRSALCVPIKARRLDARDPTPTPSPSADIVGVIYIDSSVANYTYAPDQLRLLTAIGLQAGLAIQNAKLYQGQLEAERLAAIGETTAALSHSIKNILQALRGGADVVEMGLKGNNLPQAGKGWRVVERNLDKIYHLTMNLLSYSRPREPDLEPVNPRKLVEECVELISQNASDRGVMVVSDVDKDHPAIPMDAAGMHQVIMNLLSNALDAVESGKGLVRVECHYDGENKQSVMEVSDNGIGIPPSMRKHMFELFHSTKGNRGTGLGLAVAKKIVDEHEGTISVTSAPGQGTTFTIKLPVYHQTLTDPAHTHGPR
jgi:two-component system NtrC family sensor kinase